MNYVGRAKTLRSELATAGVTIDERSFSRSILRGLPAGYAMIKRVLKSKKRELRSAMVTSKLLATEKELASADDADIPPAVLAYKSRFVMKKEKKKEDVFKKGTCFYYKQRGHDIAHCLKRKAKDGKEPRGGKRYPDTGEDAKGGMKLVFAARMVPPGSPNGMGILREDVCVVDSACTHHMANGKRNFNVTDAGQDDPVTLAAGVTVAADGLG
eukprot:contig_13253_g3163